MLQTRGQHQLSDYEHNCRMLQTRGQHQLSDYEHNCRMLQTRGQHQLSDLGGVIESGRVTTRGTAPCNLGAPLGRTEIRLKLHVTRVAVVAYYLQRPIEWIVPVRPLQARVGVTTSNGAGNVMLFWKITDRINFEDRSADLRMFLLAVFRPIHTSD